MTREAAESWGRGGVLVIGPVPPPVHGYSVVTAFVAQKLGEIADVDIVNVAPDGLVRDLRYHRQRLQRAARALWRVMQRARYKRTLYFAIAGGAGVLYDLPLALMARFLGYRIYVHHHSFNYINRRSRLTAFLIDIMGTATTHICLSSGMARRLTALYPRACHTIVVSNAALVPLAEPRPARSGPIHVGFLSNLILEKGIDTAIEVARSLRAAKHDIILDVAGPALTADMQQVIADTQDELGDAFIYHGPVYGPQKAAFFRGLDVFLFPTRYVNEAQPLVVLEALAAGIPVLATNRGCIAEDVGASGAAFPDAEYLERSVRTIASWCGDRERLNALSLATAAQAKEAHAAASAELAALARAMIEG